MARSERRFYSDALENLTTICVSFFFAALFVFALLLPVFGRFTIPAWTLAQLIPLLLWVFYGACYGAGVEWKPGWLRYLALLHAVVLISVGLMAVFWISGGYLIAVPVFREYDLSEYGLSISESWIGTALIALPVSRLGLFFWVPRLYRKVNRNRLRLEHHVRHQLSSKRQPDLGRFPLASTKHHVAHKLKLKRRYSRNDE